MNQRIMCPSIFITFLAISLFPSLARSAPPFKSTLIPCDISCGGFVGLAGTEAFVAPGEPATLDGFAAVGATGVLKVKVSGATPFVTYQVWVGELSAGPISLTNTLSTDGAGDGTGNNTLPMGTYISGVFLMRDSDGNTFLDPRIQTGFDIP